MTIVLLVDENKKKLLENLCIAYKNILNKHTLYATDETSEFIENKVNLKVEKFLSNLYGGIKQIETELLYNNIDVLIYLRDTNSNYGDLNEFELYRLCDLNNIPFATNLITAEVILLALNEGAFDWKENLKK